MIRRHDDLIRPLGMFEDDVVAGSALWGGIAFVAYVAGVDPQLTKRRGDSPRQQLVEEQPDVSPSRRGRPC